LGPIFLRQKKFTVLIFVRLIMPKTERGTRRIGDKN